MDEEKQRFTGVLLLKDEEVFRAVHPHFFGLYELYLIWFYFISLSLFFMFKRKAILSLFSSCLPNFSHNTIYLGLWIASLLIPAIIIAVSRISLRWIIWIVLAGGIGVYLKEFTTLGVKSSTYHLDNVENVTVLLFGILGVMGTEWYRQCHTYLVSNRRIVVSSHGMWHSERSLGYDKINDLILQKSFLGSLLNFGSIIPLTATGLGSGSNMAGFGGGVGASLFGMNLGIGVGGGHSQNLPKESLSYTLFNIPNPEEIHAYILEKMTEERD